MDLPRVALLVLAVLGFLDALWFALLTYRVLPPDTPFVPRFCRMDEATCARVVDAPEARALGLPNAVYGLAWYVAVGAWAVAPVASAHAPLVAIATFTVAFSAWLAWRLLFVLRTPCPLCFLGHGVNAGILVALAVS